MALVGGGVEQAAALHICTRYLRGGSERRVRDLIAALPELDHDVIVGCDSDAALASAQLPCRSLRVEPALHREVRPVDDVRVTARLRRVIRDGGYAVVVTHQSKAGVVGRVAATLAGRPAVIHSLSMASFGPGYGPSSSVVFRALERALAPVTNAYAVVGHDLVQRYAAIGVPTEKCHVVRSGVPLRSRCPVDQARRRVHEAHAVPLDCPLVAYVGSLERRKGAGDVVPFLDSLVRCCPDAFLAIAGDGPMRAPVDADVDRRGLGAHASLLGYVSPVHDLIQAADVVVLLSRAEGISQVLIQAAAVGTPFVAYPVDGTGELVRLGATGLVVPIGDTDAAARAAADLARDHVRGTPIDVTEWSPERIAAGYRRVAATALPIGVRDERLLPC
jgi:glycosyltransferase involved in cell wall biosynthesis